MKRNYILLLIGCALIACNKTTVDFSYSPSEPRAGQSVSFSNQSSDGEEWAWSFGDGSTSTSKSPVHTYRQPGTYTVILKVDDKSSLTRTRDITVYDTIPNFTCSAGDTIGIYQDVTFTALVYNPYNYSLSYEWTIGSNRLYTQLSETNTKSTYQLFFEQASSNPETVRLQVVLNGDTTVIEHEYTIRNTPATAVLLRGEQNDYRQRIFGTRAESPERLDYAEGKALLDAAQDTVQVFNDSTFTLRALRTTFPDIEGFRIANRKLYYRAGGLYVANINGTNSVCIEPQPTHALCVDIVDNRLYWAVSDSVRYMPLVGSENNQFTTVPTTLNTLSGIRKITIDSTPR